MPEMLAIDLGTRPYRTVLGWQRELCQAMRRGLVEQDLLLLVEHPDVITLGRGARPGSLPIPRAGLLAQGYEVFDIERGGDVTYHGPGQLVGYPIFDLNRHRRDLHWYLRRLEAALIGGLERLGVAGERVEGLTGVWTGGEGGGRKIASIGIHVKQWVTFHGFALNVTTDLRRFDAIVPCGIEGVKMTSVARELGGRYPGNSAELWQATGDAMVASVAEVFDLSPRSVPPGELAPMFGNPAAAPTD